MLWQSFRVGVLDQVVLLLEVDLGKLGHCVDHLLILGVEKCAAELLLGGLLLLLLGLLLLLLWDL